MELFCGLLSRELDVSYAFFTNVKLVPRLTAERFIVERSGNVWEQAVVPSVFARPGFVCSFGNLSKKGSRVALLLPV